MKHEMSPVFLYVNGLFKTTEYKLDADNLTIKDLSSSGSNIRVLSLDSIEASVSHENNKLIPALYFISALFITLCFFGFRYEVVSLSNFTISSILILIPLTIYFHLKVPAQNKIYVNAYTNKCLFSFRSNYKDNQLNEFIDMLDQNILKSKSSNEIKIEDFDHSTKQRSINNMLHLDALYNTGMVDEITYKKISNNINQYPYENKDLRPLADVIYLPQAR